MSRHNEEVYGEGFARRYVDTLNTPYTRAKNTLLADEITRLTPSGGRVLDIGGNVNATVVKGSIRSLIDERTGGNPRFTYRVLDVNPAYFNTDGQLDGVTQGSIFPGQIPGIVGSAEQLPIKAGSIDTVVMADVLEHLKEPVNVLREVNDAIAPGGHLLTVLPAMYNLDQYPGVAKAKKRNTSHEVFFEPRKVDEVVAQGGFKVEHEQGLDYLMGLTYQVFVDPRFIPNRNPKTGRIATRGAQEFLNIRREAIGGKRSDVSFDSTEIDARMNHPRTEGVFRELLNQGVHPLDFVPMVASLDPKLGQSEQLSSQFEQIRGFVDNAKTQIEPGRLTTMLQSTPFPHWGNSVYLRLVK